MMELDNCPCSGANLPRFVQPVILAVLSSGRLHGYLVVQRLAETSLFRKQPPDATGVYRMLRNMEQEGVLGSGLGACEQRSGPQAVHADGKRRTLSRPMDAHADFASGLSSPICSCFCRMRAQAWIRQPCPMPEHSVSLYPQEVFLSAGSPFPPASCGCGTPQPFAGAVHMNTYSFIDALKNRALRGMPVSRDEVLRLLALAPDSEEAAYLGGARPGISRILWSATKGGCGAPSASIAAPAR